MKAIKMVQNISTKYALYFENFLFSLAGQYCTESYKGGKWTSVNIDGDFWLAVPPIKGTFGFCNPENYFKGDVSAITAGAAITCIALNRTLWLADSHDADDSIVSALSELWDKMTQLCYTKDLNGLDRSAFSRIVD